jgi:hypothetical protein
MLRRVVLLLQTTALAVPLCLAAPASAQVTDGLGTHNRGMAICSPLESPDAPGHGKKSWDVPFYPYYSPLVPISSRWKTTRLTPYYRGYCPGNGPDPHAACGLNGAGCGSGFGPDGPKDPRFSTYGVFTGAAQDDTRFWRMGGNGLVPYGAPQPPRDRPPDIIDMIEAGRGQPGPVSH